MLATALPKLTSDTSKSITPASSIEALSYNEENALRYTAGYVPKAIRKRRGHPLKQDMMLCLSEFADDNEDNRDHRGLLIGLIY